MLQTDLPMTLELLQLITNSAEGKREEIDENEIFSGQTITGNGELHFANGNTYKGDLKRGLMDGKGIFSWPDGVVYEGTFTKNRLTGTGVYKWPDGSHYEGDIVESLRQGKGTFTSAKGNITYTGDWLNGLKHGFGVLNYDNHSVYEGEFQFGFKHGEGVMRYKSGNVYKGSYRFDKKSGYGEIIWVSSDQTPISEEYRGYWDNDLQNGFGQHIWLEESGGKKSMRNRYEGQWFDGTRHGYGCFYYSDGTRYEGEWIENCKEGFSIFTDTTGDVIEGIFKNDRLLMRLNKPREVQIMQLVTNEDEGEGSNRKIEIPKNNRIVTAASRKKPIKPNALQLKKQQEDEERKRAAEEFNQRNLQNDILNPYVMLLRVDDILSAYPEPKKILSNLEIVILRYNTLLRHLFSEYKSKKENITRYTSTIKMRIYWQMLRKARVLGPLLSLAEFNRIYFDNPFNIIQNHFDIEDIRNRLKDLKLRHYGESERKLEILRKMDVYLRNCDVKVSSSRIDYNRFEESIAKINLEEEEAFEKDVLVEQTKAQINSMDLERFYRHNPDNIVLFRNFIDGLIRLVWAKEGFKFEKIDKSFEKYVKLRFEPILSAKSHPFPVRFEYYNQIIRRLIQTHKLEEDPDLITTFNNNLSARNSGGFKDEIEMVMSVQGLMELLERAKLLETKEDRYLLFSIVERYFDPDSTFTDTLHECMVNRPILLFPNDTLEIGSELSISEGERTLNSMGQILDSARDLSIKEESVKGGSLHDSDKSQDEEDEESRDADPNHSNKIAEKPEDTARRMEVLKTRMADKRYQGILGNEERAIPQAETEVREEIFDYELSVKLSQLFGYDMLFFEFVENLILYGLVKGFLGEIDFTDKYEMLKLHLLQAGKAVRMQKRVVLGKYLKSSKDKQ